MRKRIFLCVLAASLLIISICPAFAGGGKEGAAESKTVTIWYMNAANYEGPYRELWSRFNKQYPDIKLELVALGWSDFGPKLQAAFAGGTEPNVIEVPPTFVQDQIWSGKIAEVPQEVLSKDYIEKTFLPFTYKMWQKDGKQYGMPLNCYLPGSVVLYNQDVWKSAGVTPNENWSWEEFMTNLKKLVVMEDGKFKRRAFTYRLGNPVDIWFAWTFQLGGTLLTDDQTKSMVTSEPSKTAFQTLVDIYTKYGLDDYKITPDLANVVDGTLASAVGASYMDGIRQANYPKSKEFGWFLLPAIKPGADKTWSAPASFGRSVSKKGATKAAWTYFKFMQDPENLFYFDLNAGEPMPIWELNTRPEVKKLSPAIASLLPVVKFGKYPGLIWDSQEWNTYLVEALDSVIIQGGAVDPALAKLEQKVNEMITKNRTKWGLPTAK